MEAQVLHPCLQDNMWEEGWELDGQRCSVGRTIPAPKPLIFTTLSASGGLGHGLDEAHPIRTHRS